MTFIPEKTVIIVSLKIMYVQDMTILICVPLFGLLNIEPILIWYSLLWITSEFYSLLTNSKKKIKYLCLILHGRRNLFNDNCRTANSRTSRKQTNIRLFSVSYFHIFIMQIHIITKTFIIPVLFFIYSHWQQIIYFYRLNMCIKNQPIHSW